MKNHITIKTLAVAGVVAALATSAQAQFSGKWWTGDGSGNADNIPSGAPTSTFTATAINFAVNDSDSQTLNDWLGANGTVTSGPGTTIMDNSHVELTGQLFLNAGVNNFEIGHDDGVDVTVAGATVAGADQPGPTSFNLTDFTITAGAAGEYDFTVEYNECCGGPADLEWTDMNGTPINTPDAATTGALLGAAFSGLALARRFRK